MGRVIADTYQLIFDGVTGIPCSRPYSMNLTYPLTLFSSLLADTSFWFPLQLDLTRSRTGRDKDWQQQHSPTWYTLLSLIIVPVVFIWKTLSVFPSSFSSFDGGLDRTYSGFPNAI